MLIKYREAVREDIPAILELNKQLYPENAELPLTKADKIWDDIIAKRVKYFVAIDENNSTFNHGVVAAAFVAVIPNLTVKGDFGVIGNVVTDSQYRRKGIGASIIKIILKYAKDHDCFMVTLESNNNRTDAHAFYRSLGFDGESKTVFNFRLDNNIDRGGTNIRH